MSRFLIPDAIPSAHLRRAIPELRNPRYARIYEDGRERRMIEEELGAGCRDVPLYSHNATYQSIFAKGWHSVTAQDVRLSRCKAPESNCRCKAISP